MNAPRDELEECTRWVRVAEDDLRSAEYLMGMGESSPYNVICFLSQQSAEKYLKSLLIYKGIDFPKTHDLIILVNSLPSSLGLAVKAEDLLPLNRHGIEPRYPGTWWPYTASDAEEALTVARRVREAVRDCLPAKAIAGGEE